MGMAFADTMLAESDATVMIVDRHGKPGGHWNDAYPFVRLHQPSAFYGVNSRPLGGDRIDTHGPNAGLYELASGAEVLAYYDQLMHQHFIPSGRVQYAPLSEVDVSTIGPESDSVAVRSLVTGEVTDVTVNKRVVNASYMNVSVPSQRPPNYDVADGVRFGPVNALASLDEPADGYVVVGAGKTGADACLFLLANGVEPADIQWITPRDSWFLDRKLIQPGEFRESSARFFIGQFRHVAESDSVPDLFRRLEDDGLLIRLDANVEPTMYRCSTITTVELEQLQRIKNVVRLGRVRSIEADQIVLDEGTLATTLRNALDSSKNSANWNADPELTAWLAEARLDGFSSTEPPTEGLVELMMSALDHAEPALAKLETYVAELDAATP